MALGAPERLECASRTLANGVSSCGGYALVYCELARAAGIPARYVGFFGIPEAGSHALAEVYYEGQWHLFDPTFGVFFYSLGAYDGSGSILSAEEIVTRRERPTLMQAVGIPWKENYVDERHYDVQPLLDPPTSHVLTYWSEKGRRITFPVAFGNDATISVPVKIDLISRSVFELGEATGKWLDTWLECIDNPGNGYFFLGGSCPTICHDVKISVPRFANVVARYVATPESTGTLEIFPLEGCFLTSNVINGLTTKFTFATNSPEPAFLLMSGGSYWIDTVRYELP